MTTRELYYLNRHLDRLILWQIANAERERAIRRREFRRAWKQMLVNRAIRIVIKDNLDCYRRAVTLS